MPLTQAHAGTSVCAVHTVFFAIRSKNGATPFSMFSLIPYFRIKVKPRKLLNIEQSAVAFRYVRKHKNGDVNHYIVFTDFSLLRLLKRVDLTEELYGPFKKRALKAGVMIMKSACARLHSQSLSGHYWIRYADDPSDLSHASLMQEMSKAVKTVSDNN